MDWEIDLSWDMEDKMTQDGVKISSQSKIEQKAIMRKIKNNEIHTKKAKALSDICGAPKKNEQWRIITEKQFNAYALILAVLQKNIIDELWIAIYRINQPTVDSIIELIESGAIKKGGFVISNFFNQTKKPEIWAKKLKNYCDKNKNFKHCYTHNHAKIVLVKTGDDYFVFEGSGNMSDNARIEQYLYENNEKTFNFHKNWIKSITE